MPAELQRLTKPSPWRLWGPYLAERAWGTVREDYSADGDAWRYFPHDHARSRAYRWNEDGLLGICDEAQRLCFALALWNGEDAILKERRVRPDRARRQSRRGREGLLVLPRQRPDARLHARAVQVSSARVSVRRDSSTRIARRGRDDPEFELLDTGVFDDDRYFDVTVEYAKGSPTDMLIRITVANRGPDAAPIDARSRRSGFATRWSWGIDGYRPSRHARCDARRLARRSSPSTRRWAGII